MPYTHAHTQAMGPEEWTLCGLPAKEVSRSEFVVYDLGSAEITTWNAFDCPRCVAAHEDIVNYRWPKTPHKHKGPIGTGALCEPCSTIAERVVRHEGACPPEAGQYLCVEDYLAAIPDGAVVVLPAGTTLSMRHPDPDPTPPASMVDRFVAVEKAARDAVDPPKETEK